MNLNRTCQDNCGVAALCQQGNAVPNLCRSLFLLQHRGQCSVGLAVLQKDGRIDGGVAPGLVKANGPLFRGKESDSAIGHVSLKEPQPFFGHSKIGSISLAFSGRLMNTAELRQQAMQNGRVFTTKDDVEILAQLVSQENDPVEGLKKMASQVRGAFSLVLLTQDGVFAARDPFGFKPLVIGRGINGCAVASESPAITEIGLEIVRDIRPGEIILLNKQGFATVGQVPGQRAAFCSFEWAYTARYDSVIEGIAVEQARKNMGASLAKGDNIEADLVAPIPMSGIGHALGYHKASHVAYDEVFLYNRYSDRSYTPLNQEQRDSIAAEKLSLVIGAIQGRRIVICDDSIVRGTQMRKQILRLREAGAKEIHIRVACPPLLAPCHYGISTRSFNELIARQHSLEEIRKMLGADTVKYNSLDDFVAAIGLPADRLCLACFTGKYPL